MKDGLRTRREALQLLGAGAAAVSAPAGALTFLPGAVDPLAQFFPLTDVRLGAGPFLAAQRRDADYLLQIGPDRLLHNFHVNAGLAPKAPVYGGWESMDPWIEIRCHGHTLGHYLTACACMFASSGDARFAERVDYLVSELAACQSKTGGWLAAFPDGVAPLVDSLAGKPFAGVPWYTTHKVLAGLRDAHVMRGNKPALEVLVRFADWIDSAARPVSDEAFQKMLEREHGGMNEVLADVFGLTRDLRFFYLAEKFSHRALLDPLARREDRLDGLHSNTQIPKVIGFNRIHQMLGRRQYGDAAEFFWQTVTGQRSFATGGHGDVEHFFPTNEFARHLKSAKTMETCCTHNMLRLTRSLYARDPKVAHFDYFERALFNGILASQDPDSGMNTYFQSTRPGYVRLYHTPFDSFWCCTGSGMENHARYGESIYAHDAHSLYVNLFLSSTLEWRERGITCTQTTRFPDSDTTRLEFSGGRPQSFTLAIRQPSWCPVMTVSVNGRASTSRRAGRYYPVRRTFRSGDVIEIRVPMSVRIELLPNVSGDASAAGPLNASPLNEWAALMYGPIALAAKLGTAGLTKGSQLIVNERESGQMLNETVPIPVWSKPLAELPANLQRTDADSLTFAATGFDGDGRVEFAPWFRIVHERYNLYWRRGPAALT